MKGIARCLLLGRRAESSKSLFFPFVHPVYQLKEMKDFLPSAAGHAAHWLPGTAYPSRIEEHSFTASTPPQSVSQFIQPKSFATCSSPWNNSGNRICWHKIKYVCSCMLIHIIGNGCDIFLPTVLPFYVILTHLLWVLQISLQLNHTIHNKGDLNAQSTASMNMRFTSQFQEEAAAQLLIH